MFIIIKLTKEDNNKNRKLINYFHDNLDTLNKYKVIFEWKIVKKSKKNKLPSLTYNKKIINSSVDSIINYLDTIIDNKENIKQQSLFLSDGTFNEKQLLNDYKRDVKGKENDKKYEKNNYENDINNRIMYEKNKRKHIYEKYNKNKTYNNGNYYNDEEDVINETKENNISNKNESISEDKNDDTLTIDENDTYNDQEEEMHKQMKELLEKSI